MASKSPHTTASAPLSEPKRRLLEKYLRGEVERSPGLGEPIPRRPAGAHAPLSSSQLQIWLHSQLAPDLPLYNEPIAIHRRGPLDAAALERSLNEIVRRHESWRTSFSVVGGQPVQVVHPPSTLELQIVDLRGLPPQERAVEAMRLAAEDARRPFDLARIPLFRARLVRLADTEYRLCLTMHHAICDGVSNYNVLLPELVALHEAFSAGRPSPLSELPIQYGDYALWQRRTAAEPSVEQMAYWRRQLHGVADLELPTDRPRPPLQTFRGAMEPVTVPSGLTEALRALSRREGATLFMTLLAAFQALLHRYSGQDDLVVGTVTAGRSRPEIQKMLGFFLNPLPLRVDLSGQPTFQDLLRRVREVTLGALSSADVPFEMLVKELRPRRDPSRNPLYQVLFSIQPPMPSFGSGWDLTQWEIDTGVAKLDLYLELDDRPGGIVGRFVYNTDLFDAATITSMRGHWLTLLGSAAEAPDRRISRLSLLTEGQRRELSACANVAGPRNPFVPFEDEDTEQTLSGRFEAVAAAHPTRLAVKTSREEWTYGGLNRVANRVARNLLSLRGDAEERIALLLGHDALVIAGILGTLKAGKTYVPLDPQYPRERTAYLLHDSEAQALLTNGANLALARELVGETPLPVINVDEMDAGTGDENVGPKARPDSLAYLLYTSGSTGRPKGVMQSHRNVLRFIRNYTNDLRILASDRLTLASSCSFDASIMDVFGALLNGAALCPIDVRGGGAGGMSGQLSDLEVTIYHSTPTLYRHLLSTLSGAEDFARIRLVVLGGEEVLSTDVDLWRKHFAPEALLVNLAGQTESSVNLLYFLDRQTLVNRTSVPIGYPVADTEVLLLDADGEPTDVCGDIGIRSAHLALGYWRQPELTRRSFLPDPEDGRKRIYRTGDRGRQLPDGSLQFLGREDLQVKVRGVRIELPEIEAALGQHPGVKAAAAAVWEVSPGEKRLAAYWVSRQVPGPPSRALREFLRQKLPEPMVPSAFVLLEALPRTPSGKVDRRALPVPKTARPESEGGFVAPRDGVEAQLVRIWERVLGIGPVSMHDDFFDLGGHSLLAVSLFARIEKAFGKRLPLASLFQAPTVEALAKVLREEEPSTRWSSLVAIQPGGRRPPFYVVGAIGGNVLSYRDLARHLGSDQPLYGLQAAGLDGRQVPHRRMEDMAADYIAEMRRMQPEGPYYLGGSSFGGLVAFEMAQQLRAHGQTVGLLALFDTYAPGYPRWLPANRGSLRRRLLHIGHRVGLHVSNLMVAGPRGKVAYILGKSNRLRHRLAWRAETLFQAIRERMRPLPRELREVEEASRQSSREYSPRPYLGRITLFRATKQPVGIYPDPTLGWSGFALGGLEIHEVPGHHGAIVQEPRVGVLVDRLQECLEKACAATPVESSTHGDGSGSGRRVAASRP